MHFSNEFNRYYFFIWNMLKLRRSKHNSKNFLLRKATFLLIVFLGFFAFSFSADLLEHAFGPSVDNDSVLNLWNNKNSVWNEVFKEWMEVTFGDGDGKLERADTIPQTTTKAPLIVRITKFLLRITVALSITMVIYNGIRWMLESAKWSDKITEATQNLVYVWAWLLVALLSVTIINLLSSISISTLSHPEQYIQRSLTDEFVRFCEWAGEDLEVSSASLEYRTTDNLKLFCANPRQTLLRSHLKMMDFMNRWHTNPGDRTAEQVNAIRDRVKSNPGTRTQERLKELETFILQN